MVRAIFLSAAPQRESDEARVRRSFWRKLRRSAGRISFAQEAVAAFYCATDAQTPIRAKGILLSALAYFILPTDLLPDFIAGLGFTDDAAVLFAAWRACSRCPSVMCGDTARRALDPEAAGCPWHTACCGESSSLGVSC